MRGGIDFPQIRTGIIFAVPGLFFRRCEGVAFFDVVEKVGAGAVIWFYTRIHVPIRESITQQSKFGDHTRMVEGLAHENGFMDIKTLQIWAERGGGIVVNLKILAALTKAAKGLHTTNACGFQSNLCLPLGGREGGKVNL